MALKVPGVRIDRAAFLQGELCRHIPQKIIDAAIATTPMQAGIALSAVDGIADSVIRFERTCVTGISAALDIPGGLALASSARPSPPSAAA